MDIKTAVARRTLDRYVLFICEDRDVLFLREFDILDYIPKKHVLQIAQQKAITA